MFWVLSVARRPIHQFTAPQWLFRVLSHSSASD